MSYQPLTPPSRHRTEQLRLQNILPLFVLLPFFECLVVFPTNGILALPARYVSHFMTSRRHAALHGLGL